MNVLILSAGTRNKVVQYFKRAVGENGRVIATDCSNLAPAIYDADAFYLVPRINVPGYIDQILEICKKEKIDAVLSLIDPELSLLAKEKNRFLELGVKPIVSEYDLVEICFDKFKMYQLLTQKEIPTGKCFLDKNEFYKAKETGEISYPVFVKPVKGSASININKVTTDREIELLFDSYEGLMIQEFMDGQEYGADVYMDMISGKCASIFLKKKIRMRAGETDKSVSVINETVFKLIRDFTESVGFIGMIDIDLFEINGTFYISEVNPRFGGGYPHAYESGVDFPKMILKNLAGEANDISFGTYSEGVCMMKYNELVIRTIPESEIVEG